MMAVKLKVKVRKEGWKVTLEELVLKTSFSLIENFQVDPADDVDSSNGQVSDSSEAEIEERVTKNDGKR